MKNTKKSLLVSVLSLMLCVAMLLGTTYAWFTDSVTSGKNTITAGNLDVELYHSKSATVAETAANKVQDSTNLFTDVNGNAIKWEPGVIAYENFMVKNVGDVALKYNMLIDAWDYNNLENHNLTEVIKVCVVDGGYTPSATDPRTDAQGKTFTDFAAFSATDVKLGAGLTKTFGMILYWQPTDHDNDYNVNNGKTVDKLYNGLNRLFIEFGVNLVATQDTVEADSFDNQYDALALNPILTEYIHEKATGSFSKSELEDTSSTASVQLTTSADIGITATVDKSVAKAELNKILSEDEQGAADDTHLDLNLNVQTTELGERSATYDITMDGVVTTTKDGQKVVKSAKITTVSGYVNVDMEIGTNLVNVLMTHSGIPMTKVENINSLPAEGDPGHNASGYYAYDMTDGILHIATKSFSPFKVTYEIPDVITVPDGETFDLKTKFASDVSVTVTDGSIATIDGNKILTANKFGQTMLNVDYGSTTEKCLLNVTPFHSGSGTETDPFMIANAKQFTNISLSLGNGDTVYYKLNNSIDLSNVEKTTSYYNMLNDYAQKIVLNLNGKTIANIDGHLFADAANLNIHNGILCFNGGNSSVVYYDYYSDDPAPIACNYIAKDLVLEGNVRTSAYHYGTLMCYGYGRNNENAPLSWHCENIVNNVAIQNTNSSSYTGGLLGYVQGRYVDIEIKNCTFGGVIEATRASGFLCDACTVVNNNYSLMSEHIRSIGNVNKGILIGTQQTSVFGIKEGDYCNYYPVVEASVEASECQRYIVSPSTTLIDGENTEIGQNFILNHDTNKNVSYYKVSFAIWDYIPGENGGYPYHLEQIINVEDGITSYATDFYKMNVVDSETANSNPNVHLWIEDGQYKFNMSGHKLYTGWCSPTIFVYGYNGNDELVTYQNYSYNLT